MMMMIQAMKHFNYTQCRCSKGFRQPVSVTKMSKSYLDRAIISMGVLGVLISTYALYVEMAAESDPNYKAMCDFAEKASCSKVLTSDYSKGFGLVKKESPFELPNCVYGLIFYCAMIIMTTYDDLTIVRLQLLLAVMAIVSCFYLAFLLIFVLQDLCVVCVSTYVVNATLVALIYKKLKCVLKKDC